MKILKKKLPTHSERLDILEKTMKQHTILIQDLTKTFADHIEYSKSWKKELETGNKEIKEIHEKINKILNVKVNGRVGLEESLKDLYELTKSQRANRRLKNALKDWINSKPTIKKFYDSKFFKAFSYIVILWFIFGILKLLNINITFGDLVQYIADTYHKFTF